jgi:hypothetical protein
VLVPKNRPDFVYKYCSAKRAAQILRDLTLYYAPASTLNDLYEFRAKSMYREDENSRYRVFAKYLVREAWYDTFDTALDAARSYQSNIVDALYEELIPQLDSLLSASMRHTGITCFTSDGTNQRMWGTYGDNHAGVTLEFHADRAKCDFAGRLAPVLYTTSKLPFCPSDLLDSDLQIDPAMLQIFFCVKHMDWKDENEWRLLLLSSEELSHSERLESFSTHSISRVFLGPRITPDDEEVVREAAHNHEQPFPVYKRIISTELAQEELEGFEIVQSRDQLLYWVERARKTGRGLNH